jgi:uncharacterized protein (TIGR02996 family)
VTDHDALLRAIIENPAEDTPRLVFADWLDEHADAFPTPAAVRRRAAFIRDDIALSQLDEYDPARLRWVLIEKPQRERESWVNETLPTVPRGCAFVSGPLFQRGFPWAVAMTSLTRSPLPELPADSFPLERVYYNGEGHSALDNVWRAAWRSRLRSIEFAQGNIPSAQLRHFFRRDGFDRLERLAFAHDALSPAGLRELIALPLFSQLTALIVTGVRMGGAISGVLAGARGSGLRELQFVGCRITAGALAELLESPAARNLSALSIGGDRIGAPEKFRTLASTAHPPPLSALDVSEDAPNQAGLEAFLASRLPPGLQRLNLARCNLNTDRTRLLAGGSFTNLRVLSLHGNLIGNDGAAALVRSPHLAGLLVLDLGYSQVGDEGVEAILESPLADGLVLLDLTGSPASAEIKEVLKERMGDRVRVS